ncbi:hypothetical protein Golax_025922, partial [Gossypium laxum]|nr:hypothetical protein [Gossypium laxum]
GANKFIPFATSNIVQTLCLLNINNLYYMVRFLIYLLYCSGRNVPKR